MYKVAYIVALVSAFSMLLPFAGVFYLALKTKKQLISLEVILLALYIIIITYGQAVLFLLAAGYGNNIWLLKYLMAIEFTFFSLILFRLLKIDLFLNIIISAAFGLSSLFMELHLGNPDKLPYLIVLYESVIVCLLTFSVIKKIALIPLWQSRGNYKTYLIYLLKGLLIYSLGNLVIIGFVEYELVASTFIHSLMNIYANYLFTRTFICYKEPLL